MTYKSRTIAVSLITGLAALASVAAAQATSPMGQAAGPKPEPHHGMIMRGDHPMMEMMPGMDAAQMNRMMENCKRMMGATLQKAPEVPGAPVAPEGKPSG